MSHVSPVNVGIEVAKALGLSTQRLCSFSIVFEPDCLPIIKAEYAVVENELLMGAVRLMDGVPLARKT